jgi:hypothetical protein
MSRALVSRPRTHGPRRPRGLVGALLRHALLLAAPACRSATDGGDAHIQLRGEPPRQLALATGPEILRHPDPDSAVLLFRVTAPDSTLHRNWWPTALQIETDRGYRADVLLAPYACLLPSDDFPTFPLDFAWWSCDIVGVNTTAVWSKAEIAEAEQAVSGRKVEEYVFQTSPGAYYGFRVPVGLDATAEAVRRLARLPGVREAFRADNEPRCVLSDVIPPPPCDPWYLRARRAFTFADPAGGDSLPVSPGGWVRATYEEPGGATRTATFRF